MPELRIGCSGFNYWDWKDNFYPADLPQRKWFEYYCTIFNTVELNVTFYRLPLAKTFDKWYKETPDGFAFSLKGSRFITHIKRLLTVEESVRLFFERASGLKEKLRVVLWQFSPGLKIDIERLKKFLALLKKYPVRNTLEFRHKSWTTNEVVNLCKEYNASLCMADWPEFLDDLPVTSDFVYIRRHGERGSYATCYSKTALKKDAKRIKNYLENGRDVFIYFNNDYQGYAPRNARELMEMVK
ncbi:MAG: DUF72 domain-containing protein [Thermodesulfovibrionales bacterium]|nr:DUF72 domain-containing protein [Thermodesulfovibrionales bacterium]